MVWAGVDPDGCSWAEEQNGPSINLMHGARLFTGEHVKKDKFAEFPPVDKSVPGNEFAATYFHDHLLFGFSFNDIYDPKNPPFKSVSTKQGEEYFARAKEWQDHKDAIEIAIKNAKSVYADLKGACNFSQMLVEDVFETMFSAKYPPPWLNLAEENELLKRYERVNKFDQLDPFPGNEDADNSTDKPQLGDSTVCPPVPQDQIIENFMVFSDKEKNQKWWKDRLSEAERYKGLSGCRVGGGKRGPGGSLWRPHLIADWLLNPKSKRKLTVSLKMVHSALLKFEGGNEAINAYFPELDF